MTDFGFAFHPRYRRLLLLFGAGERTSRVRVTDDRFSARFGVARLSTPLANVAAVEVTGPYRPLRALGVRVSAADRGLTFGSTPERGLCIRFHRPVGLLRHPALTVTVLDPLALGAALNRR
jgi:hypothetical protein